MGNTREFMKYIKKLEEDDIVIKSRILNVEEEKELSEHIAKKKLENKKQSAEKSEAK